jgi:hypothetical protein
LRHARDRESSHHQHDPNAHRASSFPGRTPERQTSMRRHTRHSRSVQSAKRSSARSATPRSWSSRSRATSR